MFCEGQDIRSQPLKERRVILDQVAKRCELQKNELFIGCGKKLYQTIYELDLEGVVLKRLNDGYDPGRVTWFKVLNEDYSQKQGRHELFQRRHG